MKAFGLLCLLFPAVTLASVAQPTPASNTTTYTCYAYTNNEVDIQADNFDQGLKTDNPVEDLITEVVRSSEGWTIKKNDVFAADVVMIDPQMNQLGNFASNQTAMLFKKRSPNNLPYFVILTTGKPEKVNEKPGDNPINRMITLARCAH